MIQSVQYESFIYCQMSAITLFFVLSTSNLFLRFLLLSSTETAYRMNQVYSPNVTFALSHITQIIY
jgi:hypothetical protein